MGHNMDCTHAPKAKVRSFETLTPAELDATVRRFKKAVIERAIGAGLSHHLGYLPGGAKPQDTTNHRNGSSGKTVLTDDGHWRSTCRATGTAVSSRG